MTDSLSILLGGIILLAAFVVLFPPLMAVLYSQRVWRIPPFSWVKRYWEYWVKRSF